jgi:hypothetical protein
MTDATQLTLARHDTDSIEALWRVVRALAAKSRVLETHVESDALRGALGAVLGQPAWLVATLLEAVLAERGSFEVVDEPIAAAALSEPSQARVEFKAIRSIGMTAPELVWSGDTAARSCARLTREAIEDLFGAVETEVFIAGFSFDHASDLFVPLFDQVRALGDAGRPPPRVRVVLDCSREKWKSGDTPQSIATRVERRFLDTCWRDARDARVHPEVRYLRKSAERTPDGFAEFSMHAKCIVVDRDRVLVGSANFSSRGRDKNLEVGAIIRDYHFVQSLCAEWEALWPELVAVDVST